LEAVLFGGRLPPQQSQQEGLPRHIDVWNVLDYAFGYPFVNPEISAEM
jgi:hypothetical protein